MRLQPHETIWIIGASSGIGRACAEWALAHGAHVIASGRRAELLANIPNAGGSLTVLPLDLTDLTATTNAVSQLRSMGQPLQRILVFTGTYHPALISRWEWQKVPEMINTNFTCLLHLVHQLAQQRFLPQQLALCGSVAGYVGLPGGQPYAATKAALINFAQSLRVEWQPLGVDVKIINPGFVHTELTAKNTFTMPMVISAEQAAAATWRGLQRGGFEVTYPKLFSFLLKCLAALPNSLYTPLSRRMLPK
jgi:short-subunit dehydrogenase